MHDRDLAGEVRQEQRLLDRGIAAADDEHLLAPVEEAIASGTGGNAIAFEFLLRRKIEPARLRAGREHERLGQEDIAGVAGDPERTAGQFDAVDVVGDDVGADMRGLLLHLLHQPGTLDDVGEAWVVFDIRGDGELAAGLDALDQDGLEHRARRIDRRRVAGGTGANDHDLGVGGLAHVRIAPNPDPRCPGSSRLVAACTAQCRVSRQPCKICRSKATAT